MKPQETTKTPAMASRLSCLLLDMGKTMSACRRQEDQWLGSLLSQWGNAVRLAEEEFDKSHIAAVTLLQKAAAAFYRAEAAAANAAALERANEPPAVAKSRKALEAAQKRLAAAESASKAGKAGKAKS